MFRSDKPEVGTFRVDYAKAADFYEVLQRDMKPLYLLVFLLTANHRQAEQCFALAVENSFEGQFAFKEFTRTWIERNMIRNAIGIVCPASASSGVQRDLWNPGQQTTHRDAEINAVTQLAPLRFCDVNFAAIFGLGVLASSELQHEEGSTGATASSPTADGVRHVPSGS